MRETVAQRAVMTLSREDSLEIRADAMFEHDEEDRSWDEPDDDE